MYYAYSVTGFYKFITYQEDESNLRRIAHCENINTMVKFSI